MVRDLLQVDAKSWTEPTAPEEEKYSGKMNVSSGI